MSGKYVSLETVLEKCLTYAHPVDTEVIPVENTHWRVLVRDIFADINIPDFSRSAVDGFTIHEKDLYNLQQGEERELSIAGVIGAGDLGERSFTAGQAIKIMTGAMLPYGTAAVVKKEDISETGNNVLLDKPVIAGANIQNCGSHIKKGELIAFAGQVLNFNELKLIASCGIASISVFKSPMVYIINTGSELVMPGGNLQKGQIFTSNKTLYFSLLSASGCYPLSGEGPVIDKITSIAQELQNGLKVSNLIIISGGTAEGQFDLVQDAFKQIGAEIIFAGLDLKPGQHTSAAVKDGVLLFNLPGNPGAGELVFEVLIKPVLRKMRGIKTYHNNWFELSVNNLEQIKSPFRMMVKGCIEIKDGQLTARIMKKHEKQSGLINLIIDTQYNNGNRVKVLIPG